MDFKEHLLRHYSVEFVAQLLESLANDSTHACLLNLDKIDEARFLTYFKNVTKHPLVANGYLYNKNEYELGKHWLFDAGAYYLQDPSAMLVASLLDANQNDIVLDLCAAPGGKCLQTSLLMNNSGVIIANDISHARALTLSQNVERMGRKNIVVTNNDFAKIHHHYQNYFSKIILDAPCSGSGMFRKNEALKHEWSYNKVLKFQSMQKELILLAYQMLMPGGIIAYSTCSYSKEENEDIINHLLKNSDAILLPIAPSKHYINCESLPETILMTSFISGEGQYLALIKKPGVLDLPVLKASPVLGTNPLISHLEGELYEKNNILYLLPRKLDLRPLTLIRAGLELGELQKNIFIPCHHLSHFLPSENSINLNELQAKEYLRGEALKIDHPRGFVAVALDNINLGFTKSVDGVLKNHLPKGLRRR